MAASTVSTLSYDLLGNNLPVGSKYGEQWVRAKEFDMGANTPALAAHGQASKFQYVYVVPMTNADEIEYAWRLPFDVDVREKIYIAFAVISNADSKALTLTPTYDVLAAGETTAAGATALDGTIPSKTCTTAHYLYWTYYGWIADSGATAGDLMHITVAASGQTTGDAVRVVGMHIVWHKKR